jgi:hypothetical protein
MFFVLGALAVGASSAVNPADDVLGNIKAGRMLCSYPDVETKTCTTIDNYALTAEGKLTNTGETIISESPLMTLAVTSVVQIENGAMCGLATKADLLNAKVRLNGTLLPPDRNAAMVAKLAGKYASMMGKKVCQTLKLNDGQLVQSAKIERVAVARPGVPVQWIAPGDGYKVSHVQ